MVEVKSRSIRQSNDLLYLKPRDPHSGTAAVVPPSNIFNKPYQQQLNSKIITPVNYSRDSLTERIVHFGAGSKFFRSHLAICIHKLLSQRMCDWSICAVSLMTDTICNQLRKSNHLYTVVTMDPEELSATQVGSITSTHFGPREMDQVLNKLTSQNTRLVTLTITQNGYYQDGSTGKLNIEHEDIVHDLENVSRPRTVIGYLVCALDQRRRMGLEPFTVISCDNLFMNGNVIRDMIIQFATRLDEDLARWIQDVVAFPNTMVDRITPSMNDHFDQLILREYHLIDPCAVVAEKFYQFVIEDKFSLDGLAFDKAGIQIVKDAYPYFVTKLIMLNGSHTVLATIANRIGYRYVHDAISNSEIRGLIQEIMNSEFSIAVPKSDIDIEDYKLKTIERFSNPMIMDSIERIGSEGTRKIIKYILHVIRICLEKNAPVTQLSFVVACWMMSLDGKGDKGRHINLNDKAADQLKEFRLQLDSLIQNDLSDYHISTLMMTQTNIFGQDLPKSQEFVNQVTKCIKAIHQKGTEEALRSLRSEMVTFNDQKQKFKNHLCTSKKAIVFDCDMTLVDSSIGTQHCVNDALIKMGHPEADYASVKQTIGYYMTESYQMLTGDSDPDKAILFKDLFVQKEAEKPSVITEHCKLFDPVKPLLEFAQNQGMKLGIVTSKHRDALNDLLNKFDLVQIFDHSITGDEVHIPKPCPAGLQRMVELLDLEPKQVLYVGDSHIDAEAAQRAGIDFIPVMTGTTFQETFEQFPHLTILNDLKELHELLMSSQNL